LSGDSHLRVGRSAGEVGQLYTDQCGLVYEEGLIWTAENDEIASEDSCAASRPGCRIFFDAVAMQYSDPEILALATSSVSFGHLFVRFCI
jgi:hypothetical protein